MKINSTIVVSFLSTLLTLLGLTCHALPILANFAKDYQSNDAISSPKPSFTIDIYGSDLLSADGKTFPSSLAYYTESTKLSPPSSSSGFLILPNSVTESNVLDLASRQTVFLDINGSVVKLDQPSKSSYLSRSATRSTSWFASLRKRDDVEEEPTLPSKFVRLEGAAKHSILPASYVHYNQMDNDKMKKRALFKRLINIPAHQRSQDVNDDDNHRSMKRRALLMRPREEDVEEEQQPVLVLKKDLDEEELARLKEEEEQRKVLEDCERFESKGLLPQGSCQQHQEVQDYADRFAKRDVLELARKANGTASIEDLGLEFLEQMEKRLQADLGEVQKAMRLLQTKKDQDKGAVASKDAEKNEKTNNDDDDDADDEDEKKDEKKAEKNKKDGKADESRKEKDDGD
jgi:hypothetical protein